MYGIAVSCAGESQCLKYSSGACRLVTRILRSCSCRYPWYQDNKSCPDLIAVIRKADECSHS